MSSKNKQSRVTDPKRDYLSGIPMGMGGRDCSGHTGKVDMGNKASSLVFCIGLVMLLISVFSYALLDLLYQGLGDICIYISAATVALAGVIGFVNRKRDVRD